MHTSLQILLDDHPPNILLSPVKGYENILRTLPCRPICHQQAHPTSIVALQMWVRQIDNTQTEKRNTHTHRFSGYDIHRRPLGGGTGISSMYSCTNIGQSTKGVAVNNDSLATQQLHDSPLTLLTRPMQYLGAL